MLSSGPIYDKYMGCFSESDDELTGSITAPVTGSMGDPACTANVPNAWSGEGALGGVSIDCSMIVMLSASTFWCFFFPSGVICVVCRCCLLSFLSYAE